MKWPGGGKTARRIGEECPGGGKTARPTGEVMAGGGKTGQRIGGEMAGGGKTARPIGGECPGGGKTARRIEGGMAGGGKTARPIGGAPAVTPRLTAGRTSATTGRGIWATAGQAAGRAGATTEIRVTVEAMMKLGFIGTGNMGNPMAANLIKAGHSLTVHDLRQEAAINLLEMGAAWADSPKEAVPGNDAVLTSLPVPRDVEAVILGEGGILEAAGSGAVIFDLSTNSPTVVRRLHETCAQRGVALLDSPVSGGVYGAAAGTLAVMVGGDRAVFDRFAPTLGAIGSHVVYCGDVGAGSVCKICNNLLSMGIGVLLSEALTLGVKAGVDLATLADVIAHSSGSSKRLTEKFPRYLFQGNFEPGFATALAAKDVRLATDLGREYGVPMDLSNLVDQRHVEAMFRGYGPQDSDAVARIQEEKAGVQLRLNV